MIEHRQDQLKQRESATPRTASDPVKYRSKQPNSTRAASWAAGLNKLLGRSKSGSKVCFSLRGQRAQLRTPDGFCNLLLGRSDTVPGPLSPADADGRQLRAPASDRPCRSPRRRACLDEDLIQASADSSHRGSRHTKSMV